MAVTITVISAGDGYSYFMTSRQEAERLNARGFPIAILGAFLARAPSGWSRLGWIPLYLFTVTVVVLGVRRSLPALREGWKSPSVVDS